MNLKLVILTGAVLFSANALSATYNGTNVDGKIYTCSSKAEGYPITANNLQCHFKGNQIFVSGKILGQEITSILGNPQATLPNENLTSNVITVPFQYQTDEDKANNKAGKIYKLTFTVDFTSGKEPSNFFMS
ncbi:hypothetical protein JQC92_12390 [Shewanella sp. 202IG2-18]|uniref:hypothetical protein n=1 Tax=Parashewanella hymeniacidonis TaxID=2807618 RepID=UPI00196140FD|nr:hypothetical protein [Parashewanella hymeniacidonis]MBM7072821.1 hypothetical protein [Parashewanella hymeniacidonis]